MNRDYVILLLSSIVAWAIALLLLVSSISNVIADKTVLIGLVPTAKLILAAVMFMVIGQLDRDLGRLEEKLKTREK